MARGSSVPELGGPLGEGEVGGWSWRRSSSSEGGGGGWRRRLYSEMFWGIAFNSELDPLKLEKFLYGTGFDE